jgi:pimeloyl-ACP methyl ester carboxylesterase
MRRVLIPMPCRIALGLLGILLGAPGCASMRRIAPHEWHRPCTDGYTVTEDGWRLGIRHIAPAKPDPNKLPVVLCHGLGLNGTFWTITDETIVTQLTDRGYHVFIPDMRGSGASHRVGPVGTFNQHVLRETLLLEVGDGSWTVDDEIKYDVPAILDYVQCRTGRNQVNWIGHSLGGMLMFGFLETSPHAWRIANFVGMGSTIVQDQTPQTQMLRANRGLRGLLRVVSTGRIARPMMLARLPGLEKVDRFYYTAANVDDSTVDRFYGYTLENPGRGALRQLDPYLEFGHFLSADRSIDYVELLPRVTTPTLLIAGEGDVMSDITSTYTTFFGMSSTDKTIYRFGRMHGHVDDYGHCDLVWSRHAPREIFPPLIDWLDERQSPRPSPQSPSSQSASAPSPSLP